MKTFLDYIGRIWKCSKSARFKLNPKYLFFFAIINRFFAKYFFKYNPTLTVDGLKMSEKKNMFFTSEKAKKKLHYETSGCKKCYKRLGKVDERAFSFEVMIWTKL